MRRIKFAAVAMVAMAACASSAMAGTIYISQAAFDAAASALNQTWSEDFGSFAPGAVPDPLTIAGGAAEMVDGGTASIVDNAWTQTGSSAANATIRGAANTSLGVNALSFDFRNQLSQTVSFHTTLGIDTSGSFASSGRNIRFVGWIGTGSETLDLAQFDQQAGIQVDNVRGFNAPVTVVPVPPAALLGLGLLGLHGVFRRRRRRRD